MNDYLWIRDTIPRQRLSNSSGSRTKSRLYDNANGERERQGSGGEEEEGEGGKTKLEVVMATCIT